MMFMNYWDINHALARFADHPVLGPATRTLEAVRDAADQNSDGWAHWPKPSRAAAKLQELIQQGLKWDREAYISPRTPEPTREELKRALVPLKSFRTRCQRDHGFTFEIFEAS